MSLSKSKGATKTVSAEKRAASPLVSVIVPIYNVSQFLSQCLDSIENQSCTDIEIICVNDGSTDNSLAIINEHAANDGRYRVIDKNNEGYGASCNRGINEARGEYVAIVEPDDWVEPEMFSSMLEFSKTFSSSVDVIKTPYWRIVMPDTPQERKLNCLYKSRIKPAKQPFTVFENSELLRYHPSIWSALYRRDFLANQNIQFLEIPGAGWADNPFLIDTLCRAQSIVYLDKAFYCYREEIPEKTLEQITKNTLMPFERWNQMLNTIESLNISDKGVLRAHYYRGISYASRTVYYLGDGSIEANEAIKLMFERMDDEVVMDDEVLEPKDKILYCSIKGLPLPKISIFDNLKVFIAKIFRSLKNDGVMNTFSTSVEFIKRRISGSKG